MDIALLKKKLAILALAALVFFLFVHLAEIQDLAQRLARTTVDLVQGTHRVPQFIRDTRHPWLAENKARVGWLKDPTRALCSLDSELRPGNSDNDAHTYPPDIHRRLEINNNRYDVHRGGWQNAVARLEEMRGCPAALHDVEELQVQIYVSDGKYDYGVKEKPTPPSQLPGLFVEVLTSMPDLQTLDWQTLRHANDSNLRDAFLAANVSLPGVRHLRLGMFADWLVAACPNVEVLESGGSITSNYWRPGVQGDPTLSLIQSARYAQNLTSFSVNGAWDLVHLEAMLQILPNITHLNMDGELLSDQWLYDDGPHEEVLQSFTDILSHFPRLTHLKLPHSHSLSLGYDGGPGCGNAFFGFDGRAYSRQLSRWSTRAVERAADIVLPRLVNLTSFSVGYAHAKLLRDDTDGHLNATWPWTGRLKEWTFELEPESAADLEAASARYDRDLERESAASDESRRCLYYCDGYTEETV